MFHFDRRKAILTAALAASLAGCAMPMLPADSIDAVHIARTEAVDIDITQDADRRVVVRYRAPERVTHLDFLWINDADDSAVRTPMFKPLNGCATLVPQGVTLRHGPGCEQGATFVLVPKALELDAMYEPAQPSSDGGVLLYTGYFAAMAPGLALRWRFTPAAGDYGIDESRRHDASWQVPAGPVFDGAKPKGDQRDDEAWLTRQHASHYVYLGHSPFTQSDGMLWVRDPALPQPFVDAAMRSGPLAWHAYERASERRPDGTNTVVMLAVPKSAARYGYHGDRTDGQMLRLSFQVPQNVDAPSVGKFMAHETAHLWNHGVFGSDQERPWLHEGDAEWAALNAMRDAGLLSDKMYVGELQWRVDSCLQARGERAAATLKAGRRDDDPYGCGVALQLLGFARTHAAHADATPLAVWGALHRAHPLLDVAGFAQFFDQGGAPMFGPLVLDSEVPFASTFRTDLATYVPLHGSEGEPALGSPRRNVAASLMAAIQEADCAGRQGFFTYANDEGGKFVVDDDLRCKAIPAGSTVSTMAGVLVLRQPRAAWRAVQQACAAKGVVELGFIGHDPVSATCPKPMPDLPAQVLLPDDLPARLGLH